MYKEGHNPGEDALEDNYQNRHTATELPADSADGGDARGIEQAEDQQRNGTQGCQGTGGSEHFKAGNDALLGKETADQGGDYPPVGKTERRKQRSRSLRDGTPELSASFDA